MKKTPLIFRVAFLLLGISILVHLNRKTSDNTRTIVEFKLKMLERIQTDSLDARQKVDLVRKETAKFVENSSHTQELLRYLTGLLVLFIAVELGLMMMEKRNSGRQ